MSESREKQVFEDAEARQECGWQQHCWPSPWPFSVSVSHLNLYIVGQHFLCSAYPQHQQHDSRSSSTPQIADLAVAHE